MKYQYLIGVLMSLFFIKAFAQNPSSSVQWQLSAQSFQEKEYSITATISLADGWHLYATDDDENDISGVQFKFDEDIVTLKGEPKISPDPQIIKDLLFDKNLLVTKGNFVVTQDIVINGSVPSQLAVTLKGYAASEDSFLPLEEEKWVALAGGKAGSGASEMVIQQVDLHNPVMACGDESATGKSMFTIFLLGLAGGIIALLTPCVFPMIPVTVSFFTNRSSTRQQAVKNGALYGFFILLIYVVASIPFHLLGNVQPEIFNNISTNAWLNLVFFAVFIFFAISFFGYFDITLPAGLAGKADSKGNLKSVSGIFFMALTLVIVSFSCTGVILGTLLVGTAGDGAWSLTAGMAGFGTALALPFALFAMFPNWLKSLPKSGGWLDTVKKILAFVELGLAFKFLSNADLVMHWGILPREVFIGIWLVIALAMGAYLFGWLRLPHDYKGQKISAVRKGLGILSFAFAAYLVPGLTNTPAANLKMLSGFPPPLSYSVYKTNNVDKGLVPDVKNDFQEALRLSALQQKPVLVDFTGWACVNCRKMEEQVWTDPAIETLIKEKYILLSLYVDDREKLPATDRFIYTQLSGNAKNIVTIGDKWSTFQTENFGQSTQPLYVVLDEQGRLMTYPVGYTPNISKYKSWLECGIEAYLKK